MGRPRRESNKANKEYTARYTVYMKPKIYQEIDEFCEQNAMNFSEFVRNASRYYIKSENNVKIEKPVEKKYDW